MFDVRCSFVVASLLLRSLFSFLPSLLLRSFVVFVPSLLLRSLFSFLPSLLLRSFVVFVPSFIRSFLHSFIRSFVHSFIRSFVHSFIRSFVAFVHSFLPSLFSFLPSFLAEVLYSFDHSFDRMFVRSFVPSFVGSFLRFVGSFDDSITCWIVRQRDRLCVYLHRCWTVLASLFFRAQEKRREPRKNQNCAHERIRVCLKHAVCRTRPHTLFRGNTCNFSDSGPPPPPHTMRVCLAALVAALSVNVAASQSTCTGSTTCYGEDCDYWVLENDATCSQLEESGCDCTGCTCGEACPATCFSETCDAWTEASSLCSSCCCRARTNLIHCRPLSSTVVLYVALLIPPASSLARHCPETNRTR